MSNTTTIVPGAAGDKRDHQEDTMIIDDESNIFSGHNILLPNENAALNKQQVQVDSEGYQKALNYLRNGATKAAAQEPDLPKVYKRLWNGVAQKTKKAQQLSKTLEDQRKLEWLKLLLANNHLGSLAGDQKKQVNQDIIKQLLIYDEMLVNSGAAN